MPITNADQYVSNKNEWYIALNKLRNILNKTGLEENIKWGAPVYVYKNKNVVGLGAFKSYVGLWFFQGALLNDNQNVLKNAQEGKTKGMRQWRFASENDIDESLINAYVTEAMKLVDEGKEIKPQTKKLIIPIILEKALEQNPDLKSNFNAMGLAKQREFCNHINDAKQEATKIRRLEKCIDYIQRGIGLNDKYKR